MAHLGSDGDEFYKIGYQLFYGGGEDWPGKDAAQGPASRSSSTSNISTSTTPSEKGVAAIASDQATPWSDRAYLSASAMRAAVRGAAELGHSACWVSRC